MEIKTIQCIIDDKGQEVRKGDRVFVRTNAMEEEARGIVQNIMTSMAVFIIDDPVIGYRPVKVRKNDVLSIYKY